MKTQRQTHMHALRLLPIVLLVLASCSSLPEQVQETPQQRTASTPPPQVASSATPTALSRSAEFALLHQYLGPNGWIWRASLPNTRLVIYYGNPGSPEMGPIGQFSDTELLAKLQEQAQVYANLDHQHPVVPALDYVNPVAQPVAMQDGSWVYRMPDESITHYINLANTNHMLFFFDMQIGHSPVQKEVKLLWQYLQMPGVELALDPEFDMAPGDVPSVEFGRMYAKEINWVIDEISALVQANHLPPKILIIHQFLPQMLPDWQNIKLKTGVQVVTCVDGFGAPEAKIGDYYQFDKLQLIQYPGMKLFYKLDKPLMTPAQVLGLDPSPLMVMYQ